MTKTRRLNGRSVVVFFGLAGFDRFSRYGFIRIAGQNTNNGMILHLNTKPGPSVMGFSFNFEAQPQITVLRIHPATHVVSGCGADGDGSHLFSGEVVLRANSGAKLEGRGEGPAARPSFGAIACRRQQREIRTKSGSEGLEGGCKCEIGDAVTVEIELVTAALGNSVVSRRVNDRGFSRHGQG